MYASLPQHTHSPGRRSRRSAESGGAVVVSLLRGFGHEMRTRYAFGQRMRTCVAHQSRLSDFWCACQLAELPECDQELTRNPGNCAICPEIEGLARNC